MGKGNFFKKNIKQRKKEKKKRDIKQRILEQKKKVEEKIHHIDESNTEMVKISDSEPVVEKIHIEKETEVVIEEKTEEKVKEIEASPTVEKSSEPRVQYLIFDEIIISYIMVDNRQVIDRIQHYSEKEIKFLTIDVIINRFIESERRIYNRILTFDKVVNKLKQIGNFQYYKLDKNLEIIKRAKMLFESEKYIDNTDILEQKKLSNTNCILIELLMDKSVILVTNDDLLKRAAIQEAKERNVVVKIFDPM
tara:strand:- start:3243 stop:3992 length:750 start_codon:yes stop_codon:yes gene_type:complete